MYWLLMGVCIVYSVHLSHLKWTVDAVALQTIRFWIIMNHHILFFENFKHTARNTVSQIVGFLSILIREKKWSVFYPQHYLFLDKCLQCIEQSCEPYIFLLILFILWIIITIQNSEYDSVFSVHVQYDKSKIISYGVRHIVAMSQSLDS